MNEEVIRAKEIANQYKQELGFVNRAALEESLAKKELEVIVENDETIGFVHYHHRRDKQTTIYSIAVNKKRIKENWGRLLFYRVLCSSIENQCKFIVAKCPEDLSSNTFYSSLGFVLDRVEEGKKRRLNVWRYDIVLPLLFYCADGGRNQYGKIAIEENWRAGLQSESTLYEGRIEFVDNKWKNYNHEKHLKAVKKYKPLLATARDIESLDDFEEILMQAKELSNYCGRLLIIPKVECEIPDKYWLAFSVPTSHGGTLLNPSFFKDRFVHLLGGSPKAQAKYFTKFNTTSLDGNYCNKISKYGKVCYQGKEELIQDVTGERGCYPAFRESLKRQKMYWHR